VRGPGSPQPVELLGVDEPAVRLEGKAADERAPQQLEGRVDALERQPERGAHQRVEDHRLEPAERRPVVDRAVAEHGVARAQVRHGLVERLMTPCPTKTSSASATPSQMKEWLSIRQRRPMVTPRVISTNGPMKVSSPMVQPERFTRSRLKMRTFLPRMTSSSTMAQPAGAKSFRAAITSDWTSAGSSG
jgi:hypothetical protein